MHSNYLKFQSFKGHKINNLSAILLSSHPVFLPKENNPSPKPPNFPYILPVKCYASVSSM